MAAAAASGGWQRPPAPIRVSQRVPVSRGVCRGVTVAPPVSSGAAVPLIRVQIGAVPAIWHAPPPAKTERDIGKTRQWQLSLSLPLATVPARRDRDTAATENGAELGDDLMGLSHADGIVRPEAATEGSEWPVGVAR